MATPAAGYRLADGTRIPSVTTVLKNLGWSSGGLMHWSWDMGMQGKDYRRERDTAASVGTIAHELVEAHLQERPYVPPADATEEMLASAHQAYGAFREWEEDSRITVVATEVMLVSETYRVGGTPDWIALRKNERLILPDVKTAKAIYADNLCQVAAYAVLWEEVTGLPIESVAILRFDKEHGGFTHKWLPRKALEPAWRVFLALLEIHQQRKAVEALAK